MRVQSLSQEDPLEEEMAAQLQYSCLENSMAEGAGRLPSTGSQRAGPH